MSKIKILGFSGSLRKGSYNSALLRLASQLVPETATMEIFDISQIPLYNEDVRLLGAPESVRDFKARIAQADALLIATPEYNYSIPGVLKNAIDWASRPPEESPLNDKPVAFMGAGGGLGTARAQYHLRQVAVFTNMHPLNRPEVFVHNAREKFDAQGEVLDPQIKEKVKQLLIALVDWTNRIKSK